MPSAWLEHGDVRVGVDADFSGNLETFAHNVARGQIRVLEQSTRGRERIRAARSDREDPVVGLDDVARSGDDEAMVTVGNREQGVEASQHAIAPPVLRELHGGALQIAGIAFQLFLELLEQRKRIGRCAGESGQQLAAVKRAHLLRIRLHHRLTDSDLTVTAECDLSVPANREDGSRPYTLELHRSKLTGWPALGPPNAPWD